LQQKMASGVVKRMAGSCRGHGKKQTNPKNLRGRETATPQNAGKGCPRGDKKRVPPVKAQGG